MIKQEIKPKNIIIATLLMCILVLLVFFDYQRVHKDFRDLKTRLNEIRMETLTKNRSHVLNFKWNIMSVTDYQTKKTIETMNLSTLKDVQYDTKLGKDTIVFSRGTTSAFNIRIHGGEIILKSWLGFTKYIHINCAGYIREGRYPQE